MKIQCKPAVRVLLLLTTLVVGFDGVAASATKEHDLIDLVGSAVQKPEMWMRATSIVANALSSASSSHHLGPIVKQIASLILEQPSQKQQQEENDNAAVSNDEVSKNGEKRITRKGEYRYPIVQAYNYNQDYFSKLLGENWGFQSRVESDVSVGYKVPLTSLFTDRDAVLINPQFYIDLASYSELTYLAGPIQFTFKFIMSIFRFVPFDQQLLLSLEPTENPDHYIDFCYGMNYLTDVLDISILLEVKVKECDFGLMGIFTGDNQDCYWRKYELGKPIADVHFLNALDTINYLIPYFCNYEPKRNKHQGPWGTIIKFTS